MVESLETPCAGKTSLFYPTCGLCSWLGGATKVRHARDCTTEQAVTLCAVCPVRQECLDVALGEGETDGVWGGLSPQERRSLQLERLAGVRAHLAV